MNFRFSTCSLRVDSLLRDKVEEEGNHLNVQLYFEVELDYNSTL